MSSRLKRKHRMSYWDKVDRDVLEATSENFRIDVDLAFQNFIADSSLKEYSFQTNLNNLERKHIHQKAHTYNLVSRSHGKDPNRVLTIYKKGNKSNFESFFIDLAEKSKAELSKIDRVIKYEPPVKNVEKVKCDEKVFGRLSLGEPPLVGEPKVDPQIRAFQQQLPIYEMRHVVLDKIRNNRVLIVSSETGSGKTTQIPQYIMDDCRMRGEKCRILCTQPRRISAVSVAERVSHERGSIVGDNIGYHIRLESRLGTNSNLIYCTNGVLIRSLMSGDRVLQSLTHIIIDEVHERDKLSDFLLICLRESLKKGVNIKLILMSATIKVEKFQSYFPGSDSLQIPGRLFQIKQLFLDEVLEMTGYDQVLMEKMIFMNGTAPPTEAANPHFDACLLRCLQSTEADVEEVWSQVLQFIFTEEVSVNYQHSQNGMTALCIAVIQDNIDMVENLCNLGADPSLPNHSGLTSALSLAEGRRNEDIILLLNMSSSACPVLPKEDILTHYYKTIPDEEINYELLTRIISTIHNQYQEGAILVFLPGYDDIMMCNDYIVNCPSLPKFTYKVFCLHGSMNIKDQHQAFKRLPIRKIILATNIAETSVTIDDVVYVIDSGKAKIQTYDSCSGLCALQTQWISKACVKQRAGRAGRTRAGMCFHLFSRLRYDSFLEERIPEILRVPLEELCLNTKTLAGKFSSIYNFLVLAPDPPSSNTVKTAIENLECLGALDKDENLTSLGEYLSQLTIEPHLGKMLIYSVIFKCLDPILTIVASLAQKDPFQLPPQANLRTAAAEKRKSLTEDTFSDHMVYLKAFFRWQDAVRRKVEGAFCGEFFISTSTMETILKTRSQLLGQLRAVRFVPSNGTSMPDLNAFSDNWPMVKAVISAGLYPKLSFKKNNNYCTRTEKKVLLHNSSPLYKENINMWLVYDEMVKIRNGHHLRGVTPVTPITISLMCGVKSASPMENYLEIDEWLEFEFPTSNIILLRKCLESIITKKLYSPNNVLTDKEETCLRVLGGILIAEDVAANMILPDNIKQKPRFFEFERHPPHNGTYMNDWRNRPSPSNNHNGQFVPNGFRNGPPPPRGGAVRNFNQQGRRDYQQVNSAGRGRFPGAIMGPSVAQIEPSPLPLPIPGCSGFGYPTTSSSSSGAVAGAFGVSAADLWSASFVLIRVKQESSIYIAYDTNNWIFSPQTERQIISLDNGGVPVYLVFAVHRMNCFYGIAKFMCMEKIRQKMTGIIEWRFKGSVPFKKVSNLRNPLNNNRLIYDGVDGQILGTNIAVKLWDLYKTDHQGRPLVRNAN